LHKGLLLKRHINQTAFASQLLIEDVLCLVNHATF
jgi:hypothetical protein